MKRRGDLTAVSRRTRSRERSHGRNGGARSGGETAPKPGFTQTQALGRALEAVGSDDRFIEQVLDAVRRQLEACTTSLWLADDSRGAQLEQVSFVDGHLVSTPVASAPGLANSAGWLDHYLAQESARVRKTVTCDELASNPELAPVCSGLLTEGIRQVVALPLLMPERVLGVIILHSSRTRLYQHHELEEAQALALQAAVGIQLRLLASQRSQAAVLAERRRLARDLHDTLSQAFTGILVHLEAAEESIRRGETNAAGQHLRQAGDLVRESLSESRRSVRALRPAALEDGSLPAALGGLIHQSTVGTRLQGKFVVDGEPRRLPPDWEDALLRIEQETLTNTLKHAQANCFEARLVFDTDEVRLRLRDDGRGFDCDHMSGGLGLTGMRERVDQIGGQLMVESAIGRGTEILVVLGEPPASQPMTL